LDGLTAGRGTNEIAERLKLSASRISQIKTELAKAVVSFFGEALLLRIWT
jgi:DNA-directed RNA polymerase specialized sigma subunit